MEKTLSLTRDSYLQHRATYQNPNSKHEILRCYFNYANQVDLDFDENNFLLMLMATLEDHPGLQIDIDNIYPKILQTLDVYFEATFIIKQFGSDRVLIGIC